MASIYAPVWEQLKQNPDTSIVYKVPTKERYTFKRMVQKLKWQDTEYKRKYPYARILVTHNEHGLVLRLILNPV
jgi:hypothetical protein